MPVAHALVGASIAVALLPKDALHRRAKVLAIAGLAVAPDLDFLLVWVLGLDRDWHRGFTHSLALAALLGSTFLLARGATRYREAAICALAVASHGLLDAFTTVQGRGVALLWPFRAERFRFGIVDLWEAQPGWLAAGEFGRALQVSLVELLVLGPVLVALICYAHRASRPGPRVRSGTANF